MLDANASDAFIASSVFNLIAPFVVPPSGGIAPIQANATSPPAPRKYLTTRLTVVPWIITFNRMVKVQDRLDRTFRALSDPTRRAILARLRQAPCSVQQLAAPFDMSLAAVSKHLKVLEQAALVSRQRSGRQVIVRLMSAQLGEANDWLNGYREFWESNLDRLSQHVKQQKRRHR